MSISTVRARCSKLIRAFGDGYRPRFVFTSSIAVFGAPFPDSIPDDFSLTPLTSYGTQKAMARADARRLYAPRLSRRHRHPAAEYRGAARKAEQGGLRFFLLDHPRAAQRRGGDAAGGRGRAKLARKPARRRGLSRSTAPSSMAKEIGPRINLTMPGRLLHRRRADRRAPADAGDKVAARIRRAPDPLIAPHRRRLAGSL